jgi:hypothetical protein
MKPFSLPLRSLDAPLEKAVFLPHKGHLPSSIIHLTSYLFLKISLIFRNLL